MNHTDNDTAVLLSWEENAQPWTNAIREQRIDSRTLVTNKAIVDAVLATQAATALDLGCGEGWLSWRLASNGIAVTGTDAIASLVQSAQQTSGSKAAQTPRFLHMTYNELPGSLSGMHFDVIVCNFSLLDKEGVEALLAAVPELLVPGGHLLIQTLHPQIFAEEQGNQDGWRRESWAGMGGEFRGTAPWYYRTLSSWHRLFAQSGLQLQHTQEPLHPYTGDADSIIFVLKAAPGSRVS